MEVKINLINSLKQLSYELRNWDYPWSRRRAAARGAPAPRVVLPRRVPSRGPSRKVTEESERGAAWPVQMVGKAGLARGGPARREAPETLSKLIANIAWRRGRPAAVF